MLKFINPIFNRSRSRFHALSNSRIPHHSTSLIIRIQRIPRHNLPMIKNHLRERLTVRCTPQIFIESKGFHDGEMCLERLEWGAFALCFIDDDSSFLGEKGVYGADGTFVDLDVDEVKGLDEGGFGVQNCTADTSSDRFKHLTHATMDGIGVELDVGDLKSDTTELFSGEGTLHGCVRKGRDDRVLDFSRIDTDGRVDNDIGVAIGGTESKNLSRLIDIPSVIVGHQSSSSLELLSRVEFAGLNVVDKLISQRLSSHVHSVVFVGRLCESHS
jgi:hypothetical protein